MSLYYSSSDLDFLRQHLSSSILPDLEMSPFVLTDHYRNLIEKATDKDALILQILPQQREKTLKTNLDPFNEKNQSPLPGIIRRYKNRIIIIINNTCASYCRYCTRKWNWETGQSFNPADFSLLADYLFAHPEIEEVIISGGEPLLSANNYLASYIDFLSRIPQIKVLRIGTRILTFNPHRITDELILTLKKYPSLWLMTHFNHPEEIDDITREKIALLVDNGIPLANQSVLLSGINNSLQVLANLCETLVSLRIKPYYLFLCDPVPGTEHFWMDNETAKKLYHDLMVEISGLALPLLIRDSNEGKKYAG